MTEPSLLEQINLDRALGSQLLFPHRHPQDFADAHVEVMDLWRSADEFVAIEAFREFGKSTLAEEAICMEGCFGNFHYLLLIGETYAKACQRLFAIDYECRTNRLLHQMFGGRVLARKSIENKMWFRSGAVIEAMGWEQELQSFKEGTHRPDRAYLDDPENAERVRDKAAVDSSMKKLYLELIPAMDKNARKIRLSQTRRAEDCMMTRCAVNPEWVYRGFPICSGEVDNPEAVATWPDRYPMQWIRAEKARYQGSGMLAEFLQAYMLQTTDYEAKPFKDAMLQSMDVSPWHWMPRSAIYDPSRTTNERRTKTQTQSDQTGKVVVSRMGSQILVHESEGAYWKPNEFIDDLFAVHERHSPVKIAIEKNSLDDWLMQPVRLEMMRRGIVLPLVALQAPQDRSKEDFIMGLQPFAQAKDIVLIGGRAAHPQLVAEWANFPQGQRNIMNALAYALRVFSGIPVYEDFSGANIGEAPNPRLGEAVYVGFNASASEVAAVAVVRDGRRLFVANDWTAGGSISDAVKTLAFEVRASFPRAALQCWVPSDTYDQWQRIALVPALRAERLGPYRGEHVAVARGCLSERIRSVWHGQRQLIVDKKARGTLNSLAAGYALPTERGGRSASEPEPGISRLIAEALECMVAILDKTDDAMASGFPVGANIAHTANGVPYVSSNPRARA